MSLVLVKHFFLPLMLCCSSCGSMTHLRHYNSSVPVIAMSIPNHTIKTISIHKTNWFFFLTNFKTCRIAIKLYISDYLELIQDVCCAGRRARAEQSRAGRRKWEVEQITNGKWIAWHQPKYSPKSFGKKIIFNSSSSCSGFHDFHGIHLCWKLISYIFSKFKLAMERNWLSAGSAMEYFHVIELFISTTTFYRLEWEI